MKIFSWYKHFRDILITKYLNISLQFYLCEDETLYVSWASFGDRLWLRLMVWYKTIVFKSLFERFFTLYYEKKGFFFPSKSAWLLLFFLTLLKCNCKLISDVGFCLCLFSWSAASFFYWPTHGLCHFQLLSWSHWLESIQKRENALFQNMWLVELRRWRIRYIYIYIRV